MLTEILHRFGKEAYNRLKIRQQVLDSCLDRYQDNHPVKFALMRPVAEVVADIEATVFYNNYSH